MALMDKEIVQPFRLPAELSINCIEGIFGELTKYLMEIEELRIDGSAVTYIDACGLQVLLSAGKEALCYGRKTYLVNSSHYLNHVMTFTGSFRVLPLWTEDSDEPLWRFSEGR